MCECIILFYLSNGPPKKKKEEEETLEKCLNNIDRGRSSDTQDTRGTGVYIYIAIG